MPRPEPPPCIGVVLPAPRLPAPLDALDALAGARHPFLRHALGRGHRGVPWSFLAADPLEVLCATQVGPARRLSARLAALRPRAVTRHGAAMPFAGGWAGMLGYAARAAVERSPAPRRGPLGFPAIWLGHYAAVAGWTHRAGTGYVAGLGATREEAESRARAFRHRLQAGGPGAHAADGSAALSGRPRARGEPLDFRRAVAAARRAVLAGDIFQANISQRFDARVKGTPTGLFRRLATAQPAPYMTFVDVGGGRSILSASPERFLRVRGRVLETDPMKGTRPRGVTRTEDRRLKQALETSEKDRAELAMIVDLSRNDLARVCKAGTVRVVVARRLIPFARVHQAIAVVRGRLAGGCDRVDALEAAFPPGSVTGAPKVRAMEIIDELEDEGRGPYCGALGWFDEGGDMDLSVAIRTILLSGRSASYRVGGGITLGSDPHDEWRESLDKGRGLYAALCGEEDEA